MNHVVCEDAEDNPLIASKLLLKYHHGEQIRLWSVCPGNKEKEQGGGGGGILFEGLQARI